MIRSRETKTVLNLSKPQKGRLCIYLTGIAVIQMLRIGPANVLSCSVNIHNNLLYFCLESYISRLTSPPLPINQNIQNKCLIQRWAEIPSIKTLYNSCATAICSSQHGSGLYIVLLYSTYTF